MADTTTPVYSFVLPEIDGSDGTWGTKLNSNLTALDGLLSGSANLQNASFTGTASFGGSTGTAGQVLKSQGAGANAIWTDDSNTTYTAGSGLSLTGTEFANTAPDQTVVLTGAGATSISGTYPNFTITSTNTTYSVGDGGLTEINFTSADNTKLDGIEASADVTDTANVTAAGALMDSELTSEASVKALDQGVATTDSPAFVNLTLSGTGSVKVPSGTTAQRDGSPANGMFRYNSTTEEFEGYSDGEWGSIGGGGGGGSNLNIDTMTGDGSDTTLTLSINPTVENNTQVYIDGVYQNKDTYSVSGTTLTFSTAPPTGSAVEVMTITPTALLVPADGSVTPAKIASGDFYFDTNTLYVDSTNNRVGIGTGSPATALDTNGIVRASSAYSLSYAGVDGSTSAFGAGTISADANWGMFFKSTTGASVAEFAWVNAAGTERMRIDPAGKVGIGTSLPASKAHILGSSNDTINQANANLNVEGLGGNGMLFGTQATSPYRSYIQAGFVDNLATATYDLLLNPQGGNVGIGTSSPNYELSVHESTANADARIHLTNADTGTTTADGFQIIMNGANAGRQVNLLNREASPMAFWTSNTERMRIDSIGALIVGKTTSSASTRGFVVGPNGGAFSSIPAGNTYHVYNTTNPGYTFYVGYTGGVINYQANNVNLSDEREKKNIEPLESKWDSVKSWSLKTFHYNHQADESTKNYGVIAQDVEQTNPEAIDAYQKDENTERKGVKEQQMMWMAIKALQEAQTRIETLETRIAALEE